MMKKWVCCFLLILSFPFLQILKAQNISNEGTDFWAVFPTHDASNQGNEVRLANITVFITSKDTTTVTVSCGSYKQKQFIPANTSVAFDVTRLDAYIEPVGTDSILKNKGIHIVVADGRTKVAAYAHIYAGFRSAASLILPVEALGQKYYSMNYTQDGSGRNYIVLVATVPNTTVLIHKADGSIKKVAFKNAGDVFEYIEDPKIDLTGTYVEVDPETSACKNFGVFSGSTSDVIGTCTDSRDPLYQQLYPVNSWGKNYGIVPFFGRRYILRFLAQEDNTTVNFNGNSIVIQKKGEFYQTSALSSAGFVSADKLISVAQYSLTQNCSSASGGNAVGDPDMVILNPVEFNIKKVTLFSSNKQSIGEKYINVCMKTSGISSFRIDGAVPVGNWALIPSNNLYSYIQIKVDTSKVSLTIAADVGFNAIACGFGSAESYAYSAGTNLASSTYLLVTNASSQIESPDACIQEPADFKVFLPYTVRKISWKLNNEQEDSYNLPVADTINVNGEVRYSYLYPKNKQFTIVGPDTMYVHVDLQSTIGGCPTGSEEFIFPFHVDALPTPIPEFPLEACPGTPVLFKDKSTANTAGKSITTWQWDFGDQSPPSTEQNPPHTYDLGGKYAVKLVVGTETGCKSEVRTDTILVRPKMTAKVISDSNVCVKTNLRIKDSSTIEAGGKIVKWIWNFGDGTDTVKTDSVGFNHKYKAPGTYNIVLITESEVGACRSFPDTSVVTVHALPKVDFSIPQVCLLDGAAHFITTAENEDGTDNGLTYLWNYGDANSTPSSPNISLGKNGVHTYNLAKEYTVTLTVSSQFSCDSVITHKVIVSGSDPNAKFEILHKDSLCSNNEVVVKNLSFVPQGVITRLIWYADINKLQEADTVDNPSLDQQHHFTYEAFSDQPFKTITIRLDAFSGGICHNIADSTITLWATPKIVFDQPNPVCVNFPRFKLAASETAGLPGKGAFSGPGVSKDGWFDPAAAGVSAEGHEITYTFKSDNSDCTESIPRKIIVMPVPTLDVDFDVYILDGGQKQITAVATGLSLKYKWVPSDGLNSADIPNPIVAPVKDTKYTLTVTSGQGCFESKTVYVHVLSSIEVANTFSPNGDGVNDYWNIKYLDTYPNATVEIFDRYGAKVFFSRGYSVPFDGNFNNQPLPVGTYYYIIDPKNGKQRKAGSLTLIR